MVVKGSGYTTCILNALNYYTSDNWISHTEWPFTKRVLLRFQNMVMTSWLETMNVFSVIFPTYILPDAIESPPTCTKLVQ